MGKGTIKASVSGIRGIIGESLTPPVLLQYMTAYCRWLGKGTVAIGRDSRVSGPMVQGLVSSLLMASGINVVDLGIVPTPTLLHHVRKRGLDGGVLITASHNPIAWNALKLVKRGGAFLDETDFHALQALLAEAPPANLYKPVEAIGTLTVDDSACATHLMTFVENCNIQTVRARKFRVAIDPGNGAGVSMNRDFLARLGCIVSGVHDTITGGFERPPEPRPDALADLAALVVATKSQVGFAQDPDADRLCIVDEEGRPLSEELTLALAAWSYYLPRSRKEELEASHRGKGDLVVNVSTSRYAADIARHYAKRCHLAKVGEANVLSTMTATGATFGGEGNGGVIMPALNPCRDSFVGMFLILDLMATMREPLSKIVALLHEKISPCYSMVKDKADVGGVDLGRAFARMRTAFKAAGEFTENTLDGLRLDFADGWVHLRESNTEPIVRIIAEASSPARARELVAIAKTSLA